MHIRQTFLLKRLKYKNFSWILKRIVDKKVRIEQCLNYRIFDCKIFRRSWFEHFKYFTANTFQNLWNFYLQEILINHITSFDFLANLENITWRCTFDFWMLHKRVIFDKKKKNVSQSPCFVLLVWIHCHHSMESRCRLVAKKLNEKKITQLPFFLV